MGTRSRAGAGPEAVAVSASRILVVDSDPWVQRTVATVLGQRGHLVNLAGNAQGALAHATKVPPDLVITTVALPAVDGWSWWERMRALPDLADTPVVFLVPAPAAAEAVRGFHDGRDERLGKPFRIDELERIVNATLRRASAAVAGGPATLARAARAAPAERPSAGHRPLSALRGTVEEIALSSVLVMLEMERKTGILLIERAQGTARLFLNKGRITRADTDGPERLKGAGAVYEVLAWPQASFDFLVGDVGGVDEIQTATTHLLMEAARRLDEMNHQRKQAEP
jgi:two-component system OmpR family response regulator